MPVAAGTADKNQLVLLYHPLYCYKVNFVLLVSLNLEVIIAKSN